MSHFMDGFFKEVFKDVPTICSVKYDRKIGWYRLFDKKGRVIGLITKDGLKALKKLAGEKP